MWIESMIGFGIQCNTEGLQIDKAGLYTNIESQKKEKVLFHCFEAYSSCIRDALSIQAFLS